MARQPMHLPCQFVAGQRSLRGGEGGAARWQVLPGNIFRPGAPDRTVNAFLTGAA